MQTIPALLEYGGRTAGGSDLFETSTPITMTKKFLKGLKVSAFNPLTAATRVSGNNFFQYGAGTRGTG